ncbi:ABC transporter ATP-binding protein [Candidatus Methylopumilus universalis]|uniref:ABC transporter ATP-binding protein n=1 Tax=Candidatus Methylopumilus universalis TaxID=2588536 RepID=UPI001CB98210|nr:ATP-binding cassette domain-containing protein [Candidatus Methylopumilus universalis]
MTKNNILPHSVMALNNITLQLKDGDRLGVMGPNGAGKSTLLRTLAGVYLPTSGTIEVKGRVASLIDISLGMDVEASGFENIRMRGIMMGLSLRQIRSMEDEIADFSGLGDFLHMPIRTYSTGMHMRLGFAVSTAVAADIILMDEWLSVGDSEFILKAEKRLEDFIGRSSILVIASHSEDLIKKTTNKIINLAQV